MNSQQARLGLAVANLALTAGVILLGFVTFFKRGQPPEDSRVPSYDPTRLQLPNNVRAQDPFAEYSVVWQQLDKPPPPPPPPVDPGPPKPTKEDLAQRFKVTLVALSSDQTSAHYAIIEPKAGGESVVITVNEQLPQPYSAYKCLSIEERPAGKNKECVVVLEDANHQPSSIILKEQD